MPPPDGRNALQRLVDLATEKPGYESLRPVVTKEIVHYDICCTRCRRRACSTG